MSRTHKKPARKATYAALAANSSMDGLISFLQRPPLPAPVEAEKINAEALECNNLTRSLPGSNPLPDINQPTGSNLPPGSSQPTGSNLPPGGSQPTGSNLPPSSSLPTGSSVLAGGSLPTDSSVVPVSSSQFESHPEVHNSLPGSNLLDLERDQNSGIYNSLPGSSLLPVGYLSTPNGRRLRIHEVSNVQDAHTASEHKLLVAMFKKGTPETEYSRTLRAGLMDLAELCGTRTHKTSARAYVRSLIDKLAIEIIERANNETGESRTYRVYSFTKILDRRRLSGLTHVISTGGVHFVHPQTGERLLPGSNLLPGSSQQLDSNFLSPSGSNLPLQTGSNLLPLSINKQRNEQKSTTTMLALLQKQLPTFDNRIADRLWAKCRAQVPDATEEEVSALFAAKLPAAFERGIANPNGFLLTAVASSCTRAAVDAMRKGGEVADTEPIREVTKTHEQQIAELEGMLADYPDHPTASPLWRRKLQELREGN